MNLTNLAPVVLLSTLLVVPLSAETIKTLDGVEYEGVKITGYDESGINILHSSGGARIHFEQLPPEFRKRYNYDPNKIWFENMRWAQHLAATSRRPILAVFLSRDADPKSQLVWEETLDDRKFKRYAKKKLIRLLVDFPETTPMDKEIREQNKKLQEEYDIEEFPVAMLLDSDGEIIDEVAIAPTDKGAPPEAMEVIASIKTILAAKAKEEAAEREAEKAAQAEEEKAADQSNLSSTSGSVNTASSQ